MQAAALGKSISGPPENLICPRDRTVLQLVPREALGPLQPNQCAQCKLLATGRMNVLRQEGRGSSCSCGAC